MSGNIIDNICEELLKRLKIGQLCPGDRIVEQNLATEFGISRTPIREAIRRLSSDGILVSVANLGTFVRRFSLTEVREIFMIREVLEGLAFRQAIKYFTEQDIEELRRLAQITDNDRQEGNWQETFKSDEQFHQFIIARCGNQTLQNELKKFSFQATLLSADLSVAASRIKRREITVTHSKLAACNTPDEAERLMREHIAGLARWLFSEW